MSSSTMNNGASRTTVYHASGWTVREHRFLFAVIEGQLKMKKRRLTMGDFGSIAENMSGWFTGFRVVEEGERLTSRDSTVIKRSSISRSFLPRSANTLHSYATKANMYGARYELLCRRILGGENVLIPEEEEEEAEREPIYQVPEDVAAEAENVAEASQEED